MYLQAAELEGSVRVFPASTNGEYKIAAEDARREFLSRLEPHGLTVLPETQKKWWKDCD